MKAKFLTFLWAALAVAWAIQCHARDYVLVQDPSSFPKASIGLKPVEDIVYDLTVPVGTRVVHVLSLGTQCLTIADVTVTNSGAATVLGRQFALKSKITAAKARLDKALEAGPSGSSGVLLPTVLQHLRSLGLSGSEVRLLIDGSPFVISTAAPKFNLLRSYPLDGVLGLGLERSRLGMAHLSGVFSSNAITWHLPANVSLEVESQRRLQRYIGLAAAKAGAALINWTTDDTAANTSWLSRTNARPEIFELRPGEPALLRPYKVLPLQTTGLDPQLIEAFEELRKSGVTRCVAASWNCAADVDVRVDCSNQFPGEPEVFFGRATSAHLRHLGDKTRATGKGFEICSIQGDDVDPWKLRFSLDLFRSTEPVRGVAVVLIDDVLYRQEFVFPPESRGDSGAHGATRAGSPHWLAIDMGEILAHPVE